MSAETPSQTAGPYVHIGCTPNVSGIEGLYAKDPGASLFRGTPTGERISITGTIFDGAGEPLRDAMIEIWQADAAGHFAGQTNADPTFTGWGRAATDPETGAYRFETIRPGPITDHDGQTSAPHITIWIVARGINLGLHTRLYFPDEQAANTADPLLTRIEDNARIATLIAEKTGTDSYRFDIHLQGERETVFLDI